ncbi:MAG: alpha-L-glutamate ligase, partial [Actinobacteria bacterium]|nr:alpha-L-glutamate ligase [Actinomycetota bacterium]
MTDHATPVVLIADHGSNEGSRHTLVRAVEQVTGSDPVCLDARDFTTGGRGRVRAADGMLSLETPGQVVTPGEVLVYESPPASRPALADFTALLGEHGLPVDDWRDATEKDRTVACFRRHNIPHADTVVLPTAD